MGYLVKGLCEIHYDNVGLSVITIQCTIQIARIERIEPVGFRKTPDFGNHADSREECFQRLGACLYCLQLYAPRFCNRCK